MFISAMGTAASYVKSMALNFKWKERKENPLMEKGMQTERDMYIKQAQQQRKQQTLSAIDAKMKSGMRLSPSDMEYLRRNSPDTYKKAVDIEKERERYRRELEQCRTQEDVEKLNASKVQGFMSEAKAVRSSSMPLDAKRERLELIAMRAAAIKNEHSEFISTPEYQELPETREESDEEKGRAQKVSGEKPEDRPFKDVDFGTPSEYDSLRALLADAGINLPEAPAAAKPATPAASAGDAVSIGGYSSAGTSAGANAAPPAGTVISVKA